MKRFSFSGSLQQKIGTVALILSLVGFIYPETVALAAGQNTSAEFAVTTQSLLDVQNASNKLKYSEVVKSDLYNQQLTDYLNKYNSPFVSDVDTLRKLPEMKRILAISFVESTMGQHCYYFNCSGITLSNGHLKKYDSYASWMKDLNNLLQKRYADMPYKKMMGVYVVPGSANWLNGTTRVHAELDDLENKVNSTQFTITPVQAADVANK